MFGKLLIGKWVRVIRNASAKAGGFVQAIPLINRMRICKMHKARINKAAEKRLKKIARKL